MEQTSTLCKGCPMKLWTLFIFFFHLTSDCQMETLDPWGLASLDPRGLIGRIYVEDHYTWYIPNIYAVGLVVSERNRLSYGQLKYFWAIKVIYL